MELQRYDIVKAKIKYRGEGSVQVKERPYVIVSNPIGTKHATIITVMPLTSKIKKTNMPVHGCLEANGEKALSVLSDTALRFDSEKEIDFDSFLASNIKRKFKTEIRDRNRAKRIPAKKLESTSNLVTEDGLELGETIPSKFDTYETACEYLFELSKMH